MSAERRPASQLLRELIERELDFRDRYSLAELGRMFGVTRQCIFGIVGPYDMSAERRPTPQLLRELIEREPDFRDRYSLAELGRMFGVTRQCIFGIVGPYEGPNKHGPRPRHKPRPRTNTIAARLRAFAEAESDWKERYTPSEVAARFGVTQQHASHVLRRV